MHFRFGMTRLSWINTAAGVWLILAGLVLPHRVGTAVTDDIIAGSIVALASVWAARAFRPTVSLVASWTVALAGLWILTAPFVLGFEGVRPAVINDWIVGTTILTLAAVNSRRKAALI